MSRGNIDKIANNKVSENGTKLACGLARGNKILVIGFYGFNALVINNHRALIICDVFALSNSASVSNE